MNSTEFVAKLKDIALNYKTLYVMGCIGAPLNAANKARYTSNLEYNSRSDRSAMIKAASADTFGFDCVCLIKSVLWGWKGDKNAVYGGAQYASNGVPDIGTESMINVCSGVSTDFSKIAVGEALWLPGHIGVYIGDGLAVECTPAWGNKVQITACNCNKSGYNRRDWQKHGKLPYITYKENTTSGGSTIAPKKSSVYCGIDVSKWQKEIDWKKVKAYGVDFAIIRLGFGSKNGDACELDPYFEKNVANAVAAGIDVGCFFYSYATSVAAVKKEAAFVIGVLKKYKGVFTYPIAFDLEDDTQKGLGRTVLTDMVIAFCDAVEKAGWYASFYSNPDWMKHYLDASRLTRFDLWLAYWTSNPSFDRDFGMWQNGKGYVNGINGNVDTDYAYKDYPTIIRQKKLNGFTGASQTAKIPKIGDVNADGKVNARDVTDLMKGILNGTADKNANADINGDGKVNARDVTALMKLLVAAEPASAAVGFAVGEKIKIRSGVTKYSDGKTTIPSYIRNATLYVRRLESGGKILLVSTEPIEEEYTGRINASDAVKA